MRGRWGISEVNKIFTRSTRYLLGQRDIFEVNKIFTRSTRYLRGQRGICEVNGGICEVCAMSTRYLRCQQGEKMGSLQKHLIKILIKLNTSKLPYKLPNTVYPNGTKTNQVNRKDNFPKKIWIKDKSINVFKVQDCVVY